MVPPVLIPLLVQAAAVAPPAVPVAPGALAVRPSAADIERAYPAEAKARRVDGGARLTCRVKSSGALDECTAQAWPSGLQFDAAAVALASLFRLTPRAAAKPARLRQRVAVDIAFAPPPPSAPVEPPDLPLRPRQTGASAQDFYPPRALEREVNGRAVLACRYDAESRRAHGCAVVEETPAGQGFGWAAIRMAETMFQFRASPADAECAGTVCKIRIPIAFALPD